jgi:hypothetical protein
MRRIFTFKHLLVSLAACFIFNSQVFTQCVPITVVANCQTGVTENFDAGTSISTSGFSGDFTLLGSSDKFLQSTGYPNNTTAVKTVFSNTFTAPALNGTINLRFDLDGTSAPSTLEIFARTASGDIVLCTSGTANVSGLNCFTFVTPLNLANQLFKFGIRFTFTGNNKEILFDDFGTNVSPSAIPLPVNFISFNASKELSGTKLTWKVGTEENLKGYEIEKSTDGRQFTSIGFVSASGQSTYTFSDAQSSQGAVFYRIRNVDNDGQFKYSNILSLKNGTSSLVLKAFPLPVVNNLTIQHEAIFKNGTINITSSDGRVVRRIIPAAGSLETIVNLSALKSGIYILHFDSGNGKLQSMKFMKQ